MKSEEGGYNSIYFNSFQFLATILRKYPFRSCLLWGRGGGCKVATFSTNPQTTSSLPLNWNTRLSLSTKLEQLIKTNNIYFSSAIDFSLNQKKKR